MTSSLNRWFELEERGSTPGREFRGAVATFLTMAYILLVNPTILAAAGVPKESAVVCTAAAAGICCLLMGLYANFPLATAPGMGLNAVVAFGLVPLIIKEGIAPKETAWHVAMGVIVLDGLVMLALVLAGFREAVMNAIPRDIRRAIGAGIGLFIAFIGLVNAKLVVAGQGTPVTHGNLKDWGTAVALGGLLLTAVLMARRVKGALLIGIAGTTVAWYVVQKAVGAGGLPAVRIAGPDFSAAFHADVVGALNVKLLPMLFAVLMVDFFDTLGTATAIAEQAGLVDADLRVKDVGKVLVVDSLAASVGGALGASSVTAYIESAAGVAEGARTGLHTVIVGVLFLLCIFLAPLAAIVPGAATAPALILVGFFMIGQMARVDFDDYETAIPAFMTLLTIPLTYSIAHGIGYGFITYTVIKMVSGKFSQVHPLMYVVSTAFAAYFVWG
jgi:AGZA family xanthine/uracil permease-like MFS transporter